MCEKLVYQLLAMWGLRPVGSAYDLVLKVPFGRNAQRRRQV